MPILINIHFPEGSKGVGPFVSKETPKDLAAWHRFFYPRW